ncbi:PREDICTED: uncharacterized protein LOC108613277 [Drosophila arizonae]|uniref:Uncharacterized protein LOC108613277 n=1 Tax=Drosophila arizonae TaxID=7263 RepID=A0ABM1P4I4_DROAR|nr:PREDICTED: uncharacterized protein LOC108613277 [Drosophila arizonae]
MQQSYLILLVALSFLLAVGDAAYCGGCMESKVACYNRTHYRVCVNNAPIEGGGLLYCGSGKICTDMMDFCWQSLPNDGIEPVCDTYKVNCRKCDYNQMFVCTSRTTFQLCSGYEMSPQVNYCPEGTVCSIDSGDFCVKPCKLPYGRYECDRLEPVN